MGDLISFIREERIEEQVIIKKSTRKYILGGKEVWSSVFEDKENMTITFKLKTIFYSQD